VSAMIGMLSAIPKTPLHARLAREGRLDLSDEPECGTNIIPLQMTREELRDGYIDVMKDLYAPESYFDRLDALLLEGRLDYAKALKRHWRRRPVQWLAEQAINLVTCLVLYRRLMSEVPEVSLRKEYRRRIWRMLWKRPDPNLIAY